MSDLFVFLLLLALLGLTLGLINPRFVVRLTRRLLTRKQVLKFLGGAATALFVLVGITAPPVEKQVEISKPVITMDTVQQEEPAVPLEEEDLSELQNVAAQEEEEIDNQEEEPEPASGVAAPKETKAPKVEESSQHKEVAQPVITPVPSSSSPQVKKSNTGICHEKGSTYYNRTKNFTPYNSIQACLASGGRLPKR